MNNETTPFTAPHEHIFLGESHEKNERKTWTVIILCGAMMTVEIIGGAMFHSLALVADGLHMSTHAAAMLIAALAYTYARKHARDQRFVFGTGKLGDLAGFASAIILAMIAILIGYEAFVRFLSPVPIQFAEAIPIAIAGLFVNIASAWLLSGGADGHHGHHHAGHADHEDGSHGHHDEVRTISTGRGILTLSIFEVGMPPVFRIRTENAAQGESEIRVTTIRPDGARQTFNFEVVNGILQSTSSIPEPHSFNVEITVANWLYHSSFAEDHGAASHEKPDDLNMRAAYVHVIADAAVSVLAICGLLLARFFGWLWMDPLAGIVGAFVIANWSYGLVRDTAANLMDLNRRNTVPSQVRAAIEALGDRLLDLHVWRLGPGHFGAVLSLETTNSSRSATFYHAVLRRFGMLSHVTVEVHTLK